MSFGPAHDAYARPVTDRKNATDLAPDPVTTTSGGILRPEEFSRHVELVRRPAPPEISRWVENYWFLRWDLGPGRWFASQVLPHPTCSLTVEFATHPRPEIPKDETVVVTGVTTTRFDVETRGWSRVAGVKFRPGGLAALTGRSAAAWTDRVVPVRELLHASAEHALGDPRLATDPDAWMDVAASALRDLPVDDDPRYTELLTIVADMLADRTLVTVGAVGARYGLSPRTLQRLFTHYIGVGPKWVLMRFRLHDVVAEIDDGYDRTMTDLAHRYGWYDQTHFTRDFAAIVGDPPGQYRDARLTLRRPR